MGAGDKGMMDHILTDTLHSLLLLNDLNWKARQLLLMGVFALAFSLTWYIFLHMLILIGSNFLVIHSSLSRIVLSPINACEPLSPSAKPFPDSSMAESGLRISTSWKSLNLLQTESSIVTGLRQSSPSAVIWSNLQDSECVLLEQVIDVWIVEYKRINLKIGRASYERDPSVMYGKEEIVKLGVNHANSG